jgi:hypothetical protein
MLAESVAVAVTALTPTEVVKAPGDTVLVKLPADKALTTTDNEQLPPAGITDPIDRVTLLDPGLAVATPPQELLAFGVAELTMPAG